MKTIIHSERIPIKLWLDDIESGALEQAKNIANLPFAYKWIAIMPDCHQGYGMPIGGVLAAEDVIIPNAVGVDIGCGMLAAKTSLTEINREAITQIMALAREVIPVGFEHHREPQSWKGFEQAPDCAVIQSELSSARNQLGTLGGGNHFIEIQKGDDGHVWVMLHSGSRNFGLKADNYYHQQAVKLCQNSKEAMIKKDLAYIPMNTRLGQEYFAVMQYCCDFAQANRELMLQRVFQIVQQTTGAGLIEKIDIRHNFAAIETHYGREVIVHRKGATKASKETMGIIPGSMGSMSYIVKGLGNPESFESCSHGAGRKMGRKEAERVLNLTLEQKKMEGIVHGLHSKNDLDEAPGAYKDIQEVIKNQEDLVKVMVTLHPLGSIKG